MAKLSMINKAAKGATQCVIVWHWVSNPNRASRKIYNALPSVGASMDTFVVSTSAAYVSVNSPGTANSWE